MSLSFIIIIVLAALEWEFAPGRYSLPLYPEYSPLYILIMLLRIQMSNHMDDSYEILQLNVSQPIVFRGDNRKKNQQHRYNENKNQIILVVPKEDY